MPGKGSYDRPWREEVGERQRERLPVPCSLLLGALPLSCVRVLCSKTKPAIGRKRLGVCVVGK